MPEGTDVSRDISAAKVAAAEAADRQPVVVDQAHGPGAEAEHDGPATLGGEPLRHQAASGLPTSASWRAFK